MNRIMCFLIIAFFVSCKSSTLAQDKIKETVHKPKIKKPTFQGDNSNYLMDPNTITLTAVIKSDLKEASICNINYRSTINVEIKHIIGAGSSIINMISVGQQVQFPFSNSLTNKQSVVLENMIVNKIFTFTVKEKLCQDMNQTIYEIIHF